MNKLYTLYLMLVIFLILIKQLIPFVLLVILEKFTNFLFLTLLLPILILDSLFILTCGVPLPLLLINGYRYYVHFIDNYSKFTWDYLLRSKSETFQMFLNFKSQAELQLGTKLQYFQFDQGGEYKVYFTDYFQANGIGHKNSFPTTHEQNNIVERNHRYIVETGLTLLTHSSMPFKHWDETFRTSVYIINRLPTLTLHQKTPLEILFKTKPYLVLRTSGCACYPNTRPYNKHKSQHRFVWCTFFGYSLNHKVLSVLTTGRVFVSRDVIFDEHTFQCASHLSTPIIASTFDAFHPSPLIPIPPSSNVQDVCLMSPVPCSTNNYDGLPSVAISDPQVVDFATSSTPQLAPTISYFPVLAFALPS